MRLRSRNHFRRIANHALSFTGKWILVEMRATSRPSSRLGITVTKRYGHACQRNRFKRLVREAFRLYCASLTPTYDIIVRPRSLALQAVMQDIQQELLHFLANAPDRNNDVA